jgi:hypothetical protein
MNMDGIEIQRCNACGATFDEQETACPECGRDDCLMYPIEPSPDPRPASRHTPEPWRVENSTEIASACGLVVCDIPGFCRGTTTGARQDADAALIAAAPELLEALEGLFRECAMIHKHGGEACNQKQADEAIKAAKAAIRKATNH